MIRKSLLLRKLLQENVENDDEYEDQTEIVVEQQTKLIPVTSTLVNKSVAKVQNITTSTISTTTESIETTTTISDLEKSKELLQAASKHLKSLFNFYFKKKIILQYLNFMIIFKAYLLPLKKILNSNYESKKVNYLIKF